MNEIGRNDPCPCGSGKKYKKCCAMKSSMQRRTFSNLNPKEVKSSIENITNMVSKTIRKVNPAAADKLDQRVQEQCEKLEEMAQDHSKDADIADEDQKNNEEASS